MFVPVHENGRLIGLIAIGVRDDGQAFDDKDRARAVCFARLLRQFIVKSAFVGSLSASSQSRSLGEKYLPRTLILGPGEGAPADAPVVVRDLVGRVARARETLRVSPSEGQPHRASAGVIAETGGTWAVWEEAGADVRDAVTRQRQERSELLRELGLTLAHEFGNALVSLSLLRQLRADQAIPATLLDTLRSEIARLESVNRVVGLMQNLHETAPSFVDIRELARAVGHQRGIKVKVKPEPVMLTIARSLVEFALRVLIETVSENRPEGVAQALTLQVRSSGSGPDLTALISIEGQGLELEGIIPEPVANAVPNQGRLGVLLAKEILRMHNGDIHGGPGMDGPEILVSLRGL
jgi:hypothetical protein